jgi:hypothetical protein
LHSLNSVVHARRGPRLVLAALVPFLAILISSCSTPGTSESTEKTKPAAPAASDWGVKFAGCLRQQGINVPDPTADGTLNIDAGSHGEEEFAAADQICMDKVGEPPAADGGPVKTDVEVFEEQLRLAKCLRENGIEAQDPKLSEPFPVPGDAPAEVLTNCGFSSGAETNPAR